MVGLGRLSLFLPAVLLVAGSLGRARDKASAKMLTSPYFRGEERPDGNRWSEDDPARVDRFNQILRETVARHPGRVTLIDLNRLVSPGGRYVRTIDGVDVRAADGIHFHPEGADWLAGPLLQQLEAKGRAHRDVRLNPPPTRAL